MVKFAKSDWQLIVTRNVSFFHCVFDVSANANLKYLKKFKLPPRQVIFINREGKSGYFFSRVNDVHYYNQQLEKNCLTTGWLNELVNIYHQYGNKLLKAANYMNTDFSKGSFQAFALAYAHLTPGLYVTAALGKHIYNKLNQELQNINFATGKQQLDIIIGDITYPTTHTPLFDSQLSLLRLGQYLQSKGFSFEEIESDKQAKKVWHQHIKNFSVIPVNFNEEPWSKEDILSQLRQLMQDDCQDQLHKLTVGHKQKIEKGKLLLKQINNKKINLLAKSLQIGTYLNEYRKNIFSRASFLSRPFFRQVAEKYKLTDWKLLWKLTPNEIESLYFDNNKNVIKYVQREWMGAIGKDSDNYFRLLKQNEIKPFIREINYLHKHQVDARDIYEFSGNIANPGKIKGIAKIIMSRADFDKFDDKNILVTAMTSVDFVPLMERAAAFITNEGGITSHASIVSREMNKPCIIGTKIATQVLKDGDLVEVDANKGVVRILKK